MITTENIDQFRWEYNETSRGLADKFQVNIKMGTIHYGENEFNFKTEVTEKLVNGKPYEQHEFEKICWMYDLQKTDFGKPFNHEGKVFKICGIMQSKTKFPIRAKNVQTGKITYFRTLFVSHAINDIEEL